jgi:hypothetical protein
MIKIFAVVAFAGLALAPFAGFAHGGTEVSVNGDVRANGPIEIVGADFAANDVVRIELRREGTPPVELARIPADADGNFTETLHVPASIPAGLYELAADGEESATAEVTILEPASGSADAARQPAATGEAVKNHRPSGETIGLAVFTVFVAVVAIGLLWFSRTRTHAQALGAGREGRRA